MITVFPKVNDLPIFFKEIWKKYPKLWNGKSLLQIGGRGEECCRLFREFRRRGYTRTDLLEIWWPNCDALIGRKEISNIYNLDVREIEHRIDKYDVILWHHGCEHVSAEEFKTILPVILSMCKVFIIGCPNGIWEQEGIHDNPYEVHVKHWLPEELEVLGFDMYLFGEESNKHNVMMGVQVSK